MTAALLLALAQAGAADAGAPASGQSASILSELIDRSRAVKSCVARYRMTVSGAQPATSVRLDYRAPDAFRFEMHSEELDASSWCRGSRLVVRNARAGRTEQGSVDVDAITASFQPIRTLLEREFPSAKAASTDGATGGASGLLMFEWSFDAARQEGNFSISCSVVEGAETPFGWLTTLKSKKA